MDLTSTPIRETRRSVTARAAIDVAGMIRRVRRTADLSQAELARLIGVDQSTVARWENRLAQPRVDTFQRILGLAGLDLLVHDQGQPVRPMREDTPRDRAGRRWPAHLDVRDAIEPYTGEPREQAHARPLRDLWRYGSSIPDDHPSLSELAALREARHAATRARLAHLVSRAKSARRYRC